MSRLFRVLGAARWKNQAMTPSKFPAADFFRQPKRSQIPVFPVISAWHVSHVGLFHIRTTVFSTVRRKGSFRTIDPVTPGFRH
jgi:hypothetical protein